MGFKKLALGLGAGLVLSMAVGGSASAQVIGVSWSNFQEERWKTDEAAMKAAIEAAGGTYISADAQSSNEKQIADVESLITRGAEAGDPGPGHRPIVPAVEGHGEHSVIGYDRMLEVPGVFYLTFDNIEVGRIQAREVFQVQPKGYVFIKGSPADPNSDFLRGGQQEVLQAAIDGDIKVVGEQYTDAWLPENAKNMEQILTATDNKVDAVVASNDGTAGSVVAALTAQGMEGIPVSARTATMRR